MFYDIGLLIPELRTEDETAGSSIDISEICRHLDQWRKYHLGTSTNPNQTIPMFPAVALRQAVDQYQGLHHADLELERLRCALYKAFKETQQSKTVQSDQKSLLLTALDCFAALVAKTKVSELKPFGH